jgi:hypothetical protein
LPKSAIALRITGKLFRHIPAGVLGDLDFDDAGRRTICRMISAISSEYVVSRLLTK